MSPVRVTWGRTIGRARSLFSTAFAAAGFMAACAALFAFGLESAEGGRLSLPVVWTMAVSPVLPFLAALYGMEVWSDERRSGRIDLLLSSPVREREFVLGKFLGVWTMMLIQTAFFHFVSMVFLAFFAPKLLADVPLWGFLPGFLALALQSALWSAVSVAASAACRNAAAAACSTVFLLAALPRGIWMALMAWAPQGRTAFGEMPLDAHACDIASGLVSSETLAGYVLLTLAALFVASKFVAAVRFVGKGASGVRASTSFVLVLAALFVASSLALAHRLDITLDLPVDGGGESEFSLRTKGILSETRGKIRVTAFLSRKDVRFRPLAHFLRALSQASEAQGGACIEIRYVDPKWDLGEAERLVRSGAKADSLVFEHGHRFECVSLTDGYDERVCISTIIRIAMPPQRRSVYWTTGHGESSPGSADYAPFDMTDIARDIAHDGYRNRQLDLTADAQLPADCALVVIAGAKSDFSRVELARLDAYLRQGGRLLVLLSTADSGGVSALLSGWGVRPTAATYPGARTLSGTDVIVSEFAEHAVSRPLTGSQVVLERPVAFAPSAAVETGGGADRIEFTELAKVSGQCVVAAAERGVGTGDDLQIRPTRIIAIGDAGFVLNGNLATRANANRDFFLNCIAYLAGTDAVTESGAEPGRLVSGMDRATRGRLLIASAALFPFVLFVLLAACVAIRRRRA